MPFGIGDSIELILPPSHWMAAVSYSAIEDGQTGENVHFPYFRMA
jgi:hypothetical protein